MEFVFFFGGHDQGVVEGREGEGQEGVPYSSQTIVLIC